MKVKKTKRRLRELKETRRYIELLVKQGDVDKLTELAMNLDEYREKYFGTASELPHYFMQYHDIASDHTRLLSLVRHNRELCDNATLEFANNTYLPQSIVH